MSFSGVFQIDMPASYSTPAVRRPLNTVPRCRADFFVFFRHPQAVSKTRAHAHESYRPTFRVPYHGAPRLPPTPSPASPNVHAPALLPVSDARTRRWVAAHAVVASARIPPTYAASLEEERSVFSDDSDLESASSADSHDEDEDGESFIVESPSDSSSESSEDDDESAIFMTRNHSHLRLRSTNPSSASLSRPPSLPRGRPAARRVTTGLRPITPPSAAPVILDRARARGLSSGAASEQPVQHPRASPSLSSFVAPSLTTDDSDASTAPSISESIPIPSALSRGRCRPSRIPPSDEDSEDERWWMPSPPDAARKERERATGCGAFWDGWMRTANYA